MTSTTKKSQRGRAPVKGGEMTTPYARYAECMSFLMRYAYTFGLPEMFRRGKLRLGIASFGLFAAYDLPSGGMGMHVTFPLDIVSRRHFDELVVVLQNFVIDVYFAHEWDGQPMQAKDLARLCGVTKQAMNKEIHGILAKAGTNEECVKIANK